MKDRRSQFYEAALRMASMQGLPNLNLKAMMAPINADLGEVVTRYGEAGVPYCIAAMEMIAEGLRAQAGTEACAAANAVKAVGSTTVINVKMGGLNHGT